MRHFKIILKNKHADIRAELVTYLETCDDKDASWAADYVKKIDAFNAWDVLKVDKVTEEEALKSA